MTVTQSERLYLPSGDCYLETNFRLADLTTYRVGGPAEWFIAPQSIEQLQAGVRWAFNQGLLVTVLGAGSNLLISDHGLPGLVISTRHLREQAFFEETERITVAAGKPLPRLCWQLAKQGWAGLEWAVGIPGTIGGAVVMNAGAHGESISDSLIETLILKPDGTQQTLSNAELNYSYRSSILQGGKNIVLSATFSLKAMQDIETVEATTESHLNHRLTTQPYELPSCGSVFRNPLPKTAGWLIENSGLKGFTIGGAQISPKHANFIVNLGGAKASDIYSLISHVQAKIEALWEVKLHPEVKTLGNFD